MARRRQSYAAKGFNGDFIPRVHRGSCYIHIGGKQPLVANEVIKGSPQRRAGLKDSERRRS